MPTIEIHGLSKTLPAEIQKAAELEGRIWKALEEFPWRDTVLVARGCDHVTDVEEARIVFLRIWMKADEEKHIKDLLVCLEQLNLRLQFAQLATQLAPNDAEQGDLFPGARVAAAQCEAVGDFGAAGFNGSDDRRPFVESLEPWWGTSSKCA